MSRIWWKKSPAQITLFCPRAVASFSSAAAAAAGGENESARSEIMAGRDRSSLNGLDIFCFNPHCDARYQGRISLVVFPCSLQQPVSPLSFANNLTPTFNESVNVRETRCTLHSPATHCLNGNGRKFFEQKIFPSRFYSLLEAQQ